MPRPAARFAAFALTFCLAATRSHAEELVRLGRGDQAAALQQGAFGTGDRFRVELNSTILKKVPNLTGPATYRVTLPDGRTMTGTDSANGYNSRTVLVEVPAEAVRNLPGDRVRLAVELLVEGVAISNKLALDASDFPRTPVDVSADDPGPFGWGTPLSEDRRILPNPGPEGFKFAHFKMPDGPDVFLATTEATNAQVKRRIPQYDPRRGRSDEFNLEAPDQPAIGLTAGEAEAFVMSLGDEKSPGPIFRLPTDVEWRLAAAGGRSGPFWWGTKPVDLSAVNVLGPEPALAVDSTAPATPGDRDGFRPNPWGLFHLPGNVEEWVSVPAQGMKHARIGGHFRTEPEDLDLAAKPFADDQVGPDPYVGVRPAFTIGKETVAALDAELAKHPSLASARLAFDSSRATVVLEGSVPDGNARRLADQIVGKSWFVAAVENRLETPRKAASQIAEILRPSGAIRITVPLGRRMIEFPIDVRWSEPLPVSGSNWYVNVFGSGGVFSHRFVDGEPRGSGRVKVVAEDARLGAVEADGKSPATVAISLGGPVERLDDPRIVSNAYPIRLPRR